MDRRKLLAGFLAVTPTGHVIKNASPVTMVFAGK
jgi:hypothetical protein